MAELKLTATEQLALCNEFDLSVDTLEEYLNNWNTMSFNKFRNYLIISTFE